MAPWDRSASTTSSPRGSCWTASSGSPRWRTAGCSAPGVGGPIYLKCENLQRTGSFKIRGAYTRIARMTAEAARGRGGRGQRRQPRPGGGAGRAAARHHGDGLHAGQRAAAEGRRDPGVRGRGAADRVHRGRGAGASPGRTRRRPARCWCTRSTTPTSSPGRAPSGWRCWSSARTCAPWSCAPAAAGWSPASGSRSRRCGRRSRVVAVQAEAAAAYPAVADRRPAGAAGADGDDGRRDRRRLPGRGHRSRSSSTWWTRSSPSPRTRMSRALLLCLERAKLVVEPAGVAAVAARAGGAGALRAAGGGGAVRRQRRPGAAAAGDPARHGRGRALPVRPGADRRPAGRAGRAARACWPSRARTCWTSSTPGPPPGCTSARSRWRCRWRPAAQRAPGRAAGRAAAPPGTRRACPDRPAVRRKSWSRPRRKAGAFCRYPLDSLAAAAAAALATCVRKEGRALPAITAEGLTKVYGSRAGEVRALDGLDLTVEEGTVLGLLGPNGAGKTTTVRILATLLRPDSGRATVLGYDVVRGRPAAAARDRPVGAVRRGRRKPDRRGEPVDVRPALPAAQRGPPRRGPASCWSSSS